MSLALLACHGSTEPDTTADCDRDGDSHAALTCHGGDDCDDEDAAVHPGAPEICNDRDDDCDGKQPDATEWFVDADHDGYGDAANSVTACSPPDGYVARATDCDDSAPEIHIG